MRIIIFGPQGIGKGTHADLISKRYGIPHISIGDMLRDEARKGTEIGRRIKEVMNSGALIPDETAYELIRRRLAQDDAKRGFILDGYPRNVSQAKDLEKITGVDVVLFLNGPIDVLVARMAARTTCEKCGKQYNSAMPELTPRKAGICDVDGARLAQREDDTPEAMKVRLDIYEKDTKPLANFYSSKLIKIMFNEPNAPTEKNFELVSKALDRIEKRLKSAGSEKQA